MLQRVLPLSQAIEIVKRAKVDKNLIIDVSACGHSITNQASSIVSKIETRIPA